jgi:hypothetical protein
LWLSSLLGRWRRRRRLRRRHLSPCLGFWREERVDRAGGGGNKAMCLCRLGSGRTRGTLGRTRELSEPMHFGPKADAKMGARGHVRAVMSVWVEPLGRLLCPRGLVRMRSIHLGRPTGDALNFRVPGLLGEGQEVCEDQQDV